MASLAGVTRIAPTPSGFLHFGNLLNFLITAHLAEELDLALRLRIDDVDASRCRPEYLQDVFRVMDWLGIESGAGPKTPTEQARFSQTSDPGYFLRQLELMMMAGLSTFFCACTRTQRESGVCVRGCSDRPLTALPQPDDLLATDSREVIRCRIAGTEQSLFGPFGQPSYHLVNVVLDRDHRVTHVVRGQDLLTSSRYHQALAHHLPGALTIRYGHHTLITGPDGVKLSKSQGTNRLELTPELRSQLEAAVSAALPGVLSELQS